MVADRWIHLHEPPTLPVDLLVADDEGVIDPALLGAGGPRGQACRELLTDILGDTTVFLTPSCTQALELSAFLAGIEPGDEVIVPTFTFPSTANAFVLRGAQIRFADIRPDTLNIDEAGLDDLSSPRTRAIAVVHYAGVACEMAAILEHAERYEAFLVEDAAHALIGSWRGRPLGTIGNVGALSFHRTKNMAVGEGGALLVNDPESVATAEVLVSKGTDRLAFARGDIDTYTWQGVGTSGVMTELAAALLEPQLRGLDEVQKRRHRIWDRYQADLAVWAERHGVTLPTVTENSEHAAHLYWMVLPSEAARRGLASHLAARCIEASYHYQPLHSSPMGQSLGGRPGQCPVAERVSRCLLRIPLHDALDDADQERVIEAVLAFSP